MLRTLFCLTLALTFAAPALADDATKPETTKPEAAAAEGKPAKGPQLLDTIKQLDKRVTLTAEQKEKAAGIAGVMQADYAAAVAEVKLTKEQQAARKAANEKAKADGLKGAETKKAIDAALNLSPEQKVAMEKSQAISAKFRSRVIEELLTDEQKAIVAPKKPKKNA